MTKRRILKYLDSKGITKPEFYEKTGIKRGLLDSDKLNSTVADTFLAKIIASYPDLNITWLISGDGDMLRSSQRPVMKDNQERAAIALAADYGIPLIPLDAVAGFGEENSTAIIEFECEKYVVPDFKGAEFLIQVKGSSMYPKYSSGDIVACKKLPLDTFFQWNKVYVIDSEQGVLIKRVKPGTEDGYITLISENEKYDPFQIAVNEIRSLAIVIGVIRLE